MEQALVPYDPVEVAVYETPAGGESSDMLGEARRILMERAEHGGCLCPLCSQLVRVYKYTLNNLMIACLRGLGQVTTPTGDFVHISRIPVEGRDRKAVEARAFGGVLAKLRYWELIEGDGAQSASVGSVRGSGRWRITQRGEGFLRGDVCVERYIYLYNGCLLRRDGELISISAFQ